MNTHEISNDYVVKIEDDYVKKLFVSLQELKKRAEGSNTQIAWNEYHSAEEKLNEELSRLLPNHDRQT